MLQIVHTDIIKKAYSLIKTTKFMYLIYQIFHVNNILRLITYILILFNYKVGLIIEVVLCGEKVLWEILDKFSKASSS